MVRAIGVLAVTCSLGAFPLLSGCGDGGAGPAAFVPVAATVETAAFSLERITLTAGAGDRLEAGGVTAWIERPDGSRDDVDVSPSGDGRSLTLGRAAVTVSEAGETRGQAAPQADVRVLATVEANTRGQIDGITLAALDPLDTFDITGAHAHVWQPDGATAPVAMDVSADATEVTLGSFPVEPPPGTGAYWRLNRLVITGPVWVIDGATDSRTQIGALGFSFGVNDNDEVVAPTTVQACIPTLGAASDRRVVCEGLDPTDYVWVAIADAYGGLTHSRAYLPDANGRAVVPDTLGLFPADAISGPNSGIEVAFADASRQPPPPVVWPPVPDGGGPGGEAGSRLNVLVMDGPLQIVNGETQSSTELGRLRLGFEVLGDGTVVAPSTFILRVPTQGVLRAPALELDGLLEGDFCRTRVVDSGGRPTHSQLMRAGPDGRATIPDAWTRNSAADLAGPDSSFSLLVARTDGDANGQPDAF